jgi:hypothetical protein
MWRWLFVIILLLLALMPVKNALADNSADVTVSATGYYVAGNFTVSTFVALDLYNPDDLQNALTNAMLAAKNIRVGNEIILEQARHDNTLNTLAKTLGFILCALISVWAIWKENNHFINLIVAPVDIVFGLTFAADSVVKSLNWVVGTIVAIIGTYFLFHVASEAWKNKKRKS